MNIWIQFVNTLGVVLFFFTQAYGGNSGLAIISLSLIVRLAILPLSISIGRRLRIQNELLQQLQPKIKKLKARYKNDPEQLAQKTMQLYREAGYKPFDGFSLLGSFIQFPIVAGLFTAIRQGLAATGGRFLWIKNIAQPDALLALLVAVLTYISSRLSANAPQQARSIATLLPALITLLFAWRLAAGLGLYWATSTAVGLVPVIYEGRSSTR